MQRLFPGDLPGAAGGRPDDRPLEDRLLEAYAPPPGDQPFVRFNFVASIDGAATHGGLSGGLGSPADKRVFSLLRRFADVILVGAGTIRAEGYAGELLDAPSRAWRLERGMAERPVLAVVSGRLDLDPESELFRQNPGQIIVLTSPEPDPQRAAALARVAEVLPCRVPATVAQSTLTLRFPETVVDPRWIRTVLSGRGHRMIHSEGGPHLLGAFQQADGIDSLCLTTAPLVAGGHAGRISAGVPGTRMNRMALHTLWEEDGNLLAEYRRPEAASAHHPAEPGEG